MATPFSLLLLIFIMPAVAQQQPPMARPGCRDKCGNISIPYPFGIEPGCFIANQFEVFCNDSVSPPRAFLVATYGTYQKTGEANLLAGVTEYPFKLNESVIPPSSIELMDISLSRSEVRAYGAVSSYCTKSPTSQEIKLKLTYVSPFKTLWPLTLSMKRNGLVGVGVEAEVKLGSTLFMDYGSGNSKIHTYCTSFASTKFRAPTNGSCLGNGCCQVPFAGNPGGDIPAFAVSFLPVNGSLVDFDKRPCQYGMVVENSFYNFSSLDLYGYDLLSKKLERGVPFIIDFAIIADDPPLYPGNGSCPPESQQAPPGYACASSNSFCTNVTMSGYTYFCSCMEYYEGNPYLTNGCQDIDECKNPDLYPCHGDCKNRPGGYDCPCKRGMKGDGKAGTCKEIFPLVAKVIVGAVGSIGVTVVTFLVMFLKERRKMREFYKKNGGPIIEKAKLIKLFRKKELKKILMDGNIIGEGFFGEVYKGDLDKEQVAIKKPKNAGALENEQFANEVIIQSQVSHRNIVRLIGCCLEVDTPMLVYEFIQKGSLHDILHDNNSNGKVSLSLDLRLSIAAQSADGLAYMHSKTNTEILHGDVKPANILLDDDFVPKISDFGLSRLIMRDTKQPELVIGDMSYMDPVYKRDGRLTGKSDVYSFGVVLLELISRRKAVHSDPNNLLNSFREAYEQKKNATELFDREIAVTEELEVLNNLAGMAMECLSLEADQRPTMTEVAERLFLMSRSRQR